MMYCTVQLSSIIVRLFTFVTNFGEGPCKVAQKLEADCA